MMLLAGASLTVAGYEYGAWLVAITCSLVVLSWTGLFRTHYQRRVVGALHLIGRSRMSLLEEGLELDLELHRVEKLTVPEVLRSTHDEVSQSMREMSRPRWRLGPSDLLQHWTSSISRLERYNSWRKFDTQTYRGDKQVTEYLKALKDVVCDFDAKQRLLAKQRQKDVEAAIANLRDIIPPKSRAVAHESLIDTLETMNMLVSRQQTYIRNHDEASTIRGAHEVVDVSAKMYSAVRELRRW
jgi:hypothetical protein